MNDGDSNNYTWNTSYGDGDSIVENDDGNFEFSTDDDRDTDNDETSRLGTIHVHPAFADDGEDGLTEPGLVGEHDSRPSDLRAVARTNELRREREAARTGDRQLERIADTHSGSHPTRTGRTNKRSAGTIQEAADRLRAEVTSGDKTNSAIIEQLSASRRIIPTDDSDDIGLELFDEVTFESQLFGIKANSNGDWLVTVKIPAQQSIAIMELRKAFGLAITTRMNRRKIVEI